MSKKIHGLRSTRTYRIYRNMRSRCDNPRFDSYPYYGGRGITYDSKWSSFVGFVKDMGEAPEGMTLERKDCNAGYSKDNCHWATSLDQQNNKRNSVILSAFGKTQTLTQWSRELGLQASRIRMRLRRGATHEYALSPDVAPRGRSQAADNVIALGQ